MQIFPAIFFSYNVTSLFTNIPLQETIDIAINLIFNPNPNLNITRKELKKLFFFATSKTHFIFNSKFYNQIDGVAMSSPLAPVLANISIGSHESKWLNEYNLNNNAVSSSRHEQVCLSSLRFERYFSHHQAT